MGRDLILILIILVFLAMPATANSIRFTGLDQVNKSISVYDYNVISSGGPGSPIASLNSDDTYFFKPGDSYNFEVAPSQNGSIMTNATGFENFVLSTRGMAIITVAFLLILLFLAGGGFLVLMLKGR